MTELTIIAPDSPQSIKRILEAALLSAVQPMTTDDFRNLFAEDIPADTIRILLDELVVEWAERPAELVQLASGWRLRTRAEYMPYIERLNPDKPARYSRAVMETLAIIAYRQPVTRGDIEEIRGVTVATTVVKTLEERGWIDVVGYRETPGRPALFATTKKFLDDLGLRNLNELPALDLVDSAMLDLGAAETMLAGVGKTEANVIRDDGAESAQTTPSAAGELSFDAVPGQPDAALPEPASGSSVANPQTLPPDEAPPPAMKDQ
jgi:segregation and condensation protein B